jgi:methylglutaconyl-CoA hydratase
MSAKSITIEQADSILRVTLNRPAKRNALNQEVVRDLIDAFDRARDASEVRVVVLTGEGTTFSAGADLDALKKLQSASREENEYDSSLLAKLFSTIYRHPKIVIARVNGHAVAGGCGLVAAADFAIAADTAKLGFTEVKIGFVPAIVSTILIGRLRGADVRRLLLTGDLVDANEAVRMGLLASAVSPDELDDAVDALAGRIATETSPNAIALTKKLLCDVPGMSFERALEYTTDLNVQARSTDDCRAGVAAFLDNEDPPWKHRAG